MKRICIYIILSVLFISCKKDFIERMPVSTATVDAVYKTNKDFQDAVNGVYTVMKNQYQNFWIFGDLRADDSWHALGNDAFLVSVNTFSMSSGADLMLSSWRNYYNMVNRTNMVISQLENADPAVVTNKDRYMGEAKFLRAFAYFDMVRIWGNLPLVTKPLTIAEAYQTPRQSVEKIYNDLIIPDLKEAESKLPEKYGASDIGRATKGAARSILGRVYLTIKDFVNAETKLQEVTTMGYVLLPNYNELFNYNKDEHHSEYIFDIEYQDGGLGLGSGYSNKFLPKSVGSVGDLYYNVKGGAGEQNTPTLEFFNAFDPNDKRRSVTVDTGFYDQNGVWQKFLQIATFTKKYLAATPANNDSKVNWKVIRYADVLLMYAEALNENGKTDLAIPFVNQIRARAGLAPYPMGLSKEEARQKIYDERRFELGMEGVRWFDLVRTGRALTVMQPLGMKPHMTVWPLPILEVQIINDEAILPQNPGYD